MTSWRYSGMHRRRKNIHFSHTCLFLNPVYTFPLNDKISVHVSQKGCKGPLKSSDARAFFFPLSFLSPGSCNRVLFMLSNLAVEVHPLLLRFERDWLFASGTGCQAGVKHSNLKDWSVRSLISCSASKRFVFLKAAMSITVDAGHVRK